ncbi:hypothetical protein SDJN03_06070, partial [Cucurbita argyrosperma subsp. sororia]
MTSSWLLEGRLWFFSFHPMCQILEGLIYDVKEIFSCSSSLVRLVGTLPDRILKHLQEVLFLSVPLSGFMWLVYVNLDHFEGSLEGCSYDDILLVADEFMPFPLGSTCVIVGEHELCYHLKWASTSKRHEIVT